MWSQAVQQEQCRLLSSLKSSQQGVPVTTVTGTP